MTDMEPVSMLFLQALRASLEDRTVDWETDIERETWDALFAMAASHSVLPMIYAAVVRCPAARKAGNGLLQTVFPRRGSWRQSSTTASMYPLRFALKSV